MTPTETAAKLRHFNAWRRDFDDKFEQPDSHEVSEAIDAAIEMIERLEAAEKSDAELLAMYRRVRDERDALRAALQHETDCVEAAKAEIKALRAKIEAMEKQEPVAWLHESRRDSDVVTSAVKQTWQRARPMSLASYSIPLYLAPGAQPAPSAVGISGLQAGEDVKPRLEED